MAECINHPDAMALGSCEGCAESFCSSCVVEIRGKYYCAGCKSMAASDSGRSPRQRQRPCAEANEALKYAILGLFCFGIILGPMAIAKASKAKKMIAANPNLTGDGKATAAMVIGVVDLLFWVIGLIARVGSR